MPRVTHTAQAAEQPYSNVGKVLTMTAADAVNFEQVTLTGKEMIIARNTGVGARTFTVTSAPDSRGRTRDITAFSLAAGAIAIFGPFTGLEGWKQTDGRLYFQAEHAEVVFAVVRLP